MFPQPLLFVLLCPHFLPVCEGRGKALRSDTSSCRAPVKPKRTSQENGMQAHNALHSSTRQRRNRFDSVECLAPGPYRPSLPAWPSLLFLLLLMLSIWRFMQKCAAGRPPWSLSILSAGTAACHKLSYAEIVKLRLLASCLTQAILSLHFKQGWFLYGGTGGGVTHLNAVFQSKENKSMHFPSIVLCSSSPHCISAPSTLLLLSSSLLRCIFSLTEFFFTFPLWNVWRLLASLDTALVQQYCCLIKSSYGPGFGA